MAIILMELSEVAHKEFDFLWVPEIIGNPHQVIYSSLFLEVS
jgi:hypothetical protein